VAKDDVARRFDNRQAQVVGAVCFGLFGLIGVAGLVSGRLEGLIWLSVGVVLAVRGLRSSCVVVDGSGVVTRSIVRARRSGFSELRAVEVAVGRTGMNGFGREYLVLHRADGQDVAFKELNCRPPKDPGRDSVVRDAASCINGRLSDG
jgi:hypothetical protein